MNDRTAAPEQEFQELGADPAPGTGPVPMVYAAISKAMAAIGRRGVGKNKENMEQSYKFRSIDDVYNAVNPSLVEAGLVILPSTITHEITEHLSAKGTVKWRVVLKQMYSFVCMADGSAHQVGPFYGEAFDSSDKAHNKALTQAYKYMLIQVFCIPLVGIDDSDAEGDPQIEPGSTKVVSSAPDRAGLPETGQARGGRIVASDAVSVDKNQAALLRTQLEKSGIPEALFLAKANLESLEELAKEQLPQAQDWIDRQVKIREAKKIATAPAAQGPQETTRTREPGEDEGDPVDPVAEVQRRYKMHVAGGGTLPHVYQGIQPAIGGVIMVGVESFKIVEIRGLDSEDPTLFVDVTTPPENKPEPVKKGKK